MAEHAADAVEIAVRALRVRDHTAASLEKRLERRGVEAGDAAAAVARLEHLGYVDDARYACTRAETLAARGAGDRMIADDLERRGVSGPLAAAAVAALVPEAERARSIVVARGIGSKTARYLASRGFADDVVDAAVAIGDDEPLG